MSTLSLVRFRATAALLYLLFSTLLWGQTRPGGSYLGVRLLDVDADRAAALKMAEPAGAQIVGVEENSPAAVAGLRVGDVFLAYNNETILGGQQLGRLVAETPQARKVSIRIWRDGKTKDLSVTTAALPYYSSNINASTEFVMDIPAPLMVWKNMVLGLDYEPLSIQLAQFFGVKQGALIRSVEAGSLADKAGVRAGDILTGVAGHLIYTPRELSAAIRMEQRAQKPLPLDVTRERKTIVILISLTPEN